MCSPGLAIAGVSAGLSAYGAYKSAKGQRKQLKYDAAVADGNAQYADSLAIDALQRGQVDEGTSRQATAQLKGTQRVSLAARNVDLDEGSALNILADTDTMGNRDALLIRQNADREASGYRKDAADFRSGASNARAQRRGVRPGLSAATSLLSNAGTVASSWDKYKTSTKGTGK